jgi:hypothetical protein
MEETIMDNLSDDKVTLMSVSFDHVKNIYSVELGKGSNVAETAFAMTIVIKCLIKDGIIDNAMEITDLINKYLNDPQYDELKDKETE